MDSSLRNVRGLPAEPQNRHTQYLDQFLMDDALTISLKVRESTYRGHSFPFSPGVLKRALIFSACRHGDLHWYNNQSTSNSTTGKERLTTRGLLNSSYAQNELPQRGRGVGATLTLSDLFAERIRRRVITRVVVAARLNIARERESLCLSQCNAPEGVYGST
jgi:hypothetical protein